MGLEGYFINQFLCECINKCIDKWGGFYENCMCLLVEIVWCIWEVVGLDFIIIYWLLMLDLVEGGQIWDQIVILGKVIEKVGVIIINIGIGWYEVRVFIIVILVFWGGFVDVIVKFYGEVDIFVCIMNCINILEKGEEIFVVGKVDMVFMVCFLLVDSEFVCKVEQNCVDEINMCIVCNQVCFDYVFQVKWVFCLVNLWVCYEIELVFMVVFVFCWVVVVGVGLVGLVVVMMVVKWGYKVMLFEVDGQIGGQFNYVKCIFGKEEFYEILCYFKCQFELLEVDV